MLKWWRPNDGVEEAQALYDDTMYYATTIVEDLTLYDIFTLNSIDVSDRKELLSACEDGEMLGILAKSQRVLRAREVRREVGMRRF